MSRSDEVEALSPNLGLYTIGFARLNEGRARQFGSGTLISVGRIEGVLTAAHVLDELEKVSEVTILGFPTRQRESQRLRLELQYTDSIKLGTNNGEDGPDLAFLKLPPHTVSALKAKSSFVNFHRHRAMVQQPMYTARTVDAVTGVVEELQEKLAISDRHHAALIVGLTIAGNSQRIESIENMDRLEFTPLPSTNPALPESYKGVSGGGLWRSFRNNKDETIELRLMGVAYYESAINDGSSRKIICHGPESLYCRLLDDIIAKFGPDARIVKGWARPCAPF